MRRTDGRVRVREGNCSPLLVRWQGLRSPCTSVLTSYATVAAETKCGVLVHFQVNTPIYHMKWRAQQTKTETASRCIFGDTLRVKMIMQRILVEYMNIRLYISILCLPLSVVSGKTWITEDTIMRTRKGKKRFSTIFCFVFLFEILSWTKMATIKENPMYCVCISLHAAVKTTHARPHLHRVYRCNANKTFSQRYRIQRQMCILVNIEINTKSILQTTYNGRPSVRPPKQT